MRQLASNIMAAAEKACGVITPHPGHFRHRTRKEQRKYEQLALRAVTLRQAVQRSLIQSTPRWRAEEVFSTLAGVCPTEPTLHLPRSDAALADWRVRALDASDAAKNSGRALSIQHKRDSKNRIARNLSKALHGKSKAARKRLDKILSPEQQHTLRAVRADSGELLTEPTAVTEEVLRHYQRDFLQPKPINTAAPPPWRSGRYKLQLRGAAHGFSRGDELLTSDVYEECL
jgi:hypothetical protein